MTKNKNIFLLRTTQPNRPKGASSFHARTRISWCWAFKAVACIFDHLLFKFQIFKFSRNSTSLTCAMNSSVTNNAAPAANRNSFSIENILSKPDRLPQPPPLPPLPPQFAPMIFNRIPNDHHPYKINYLDKYCDENGNIDDSGDGRSEQSETRNSFTSPDSSCGDDVVEDDLGASAADDNDDDGDGDNNTRTLKIQNLCRCNKRDSLKSNWEICHRLD